MRVALADRRTDGQTDRHRITTADTALAYSYSRGKNWPTFSVCSLLLETYWSRSEGGAERVKNLVSDSGALSGFEKIDWNGSGAAA